MDIIQHNNCLFVALLSVLTDNDIWELQVVDRDAAVLTSLENSDMDTASSDNDEEEDPDLPEPLTALFNSSFRDLSPQELQVRSEETFNRLKTKLQPHQYERLKSVSRQQSKSREWHINRAGRITSTKFHHATTTVAGSLSEASKGQQIILGNGFLVVSASS